LLAFIGTVWAERAVGHTMDYKFLSKVALAAMAMAVCVRWIPIHGALSIILAIMVGVVVFAVGLLVLRAFSEQDQAVLRDVFLKRRVGWWAKESVHPDGGVGETPSVEPRDGDDERER